MRVFRLEELLAGFAVERLILAGDDFVLLRLNYAILELFGGDGRKIGHFAFEIVSGRIFSVNCEIGLDFDDSEDSHLCQSDVKCSR